MTRRIDQVQYALVGAIFPRHSNRRHFDRDAALALKIHCIEHLLLHASGLDGTGELKQAVGERGLAMIHVGDNAEVSNVHKRKKVLSFVSTCAI